LTKFASRVFVIHRRDELRATKILQEQAFANEQIEFVWNSQVQAIEGDSTGVNQLQVISKDGANSTLEVTGIFILIGVAPNNESLPLDQLETDEWGFIKTDTEMQTNLPGVYAAGDIRSKKFRQIINAAGEGANAELSAEEYISHQG
jgi:thioredoxin reductase (NADPH)